jgi:hypothetical protein
MATIDTIADRSTGTTIAGKAYFETSTNKFIVYNGSAWIEIDSDGTGAVYENRWGASFDGASAGDYLAVSAASDLSISGDCSISAWFNPSSVTSYNYIFSLSDGRNGGTDRAFGLSGTQMVANTYGSGYNLPFTHTAIATGNWYHAVVVFTSGTARMYLNGADLGTKSVNTSSISYTQTVIGGMLYNNAYRFEGLIEDVAVFDAALSAADITKIYNGTAPNGKPTDLTQAASYDTDRTSNLKGYWRMGDDSSDSATSGGSIATITDSSGNGNDATQSTASQQPTFKALAQSTTSLSFDGSNDYLEVPHTTDLELTTAMTWSVWVNMNTTHTTDYPYLFSKWNSGNTAMNYTFYTQINSITSGYFVMRYYDGSSAQPSSTHIPRGQWVHLAAVHNGTQLTYYVNGVADNTINVTAGSTNTGNLIIGQAPSGLRTFAGEIDEAAIFNSALSASDVSSLAASRGAHIKNDLSLNPVAYYRMGEDDSLTDGQTGISQITDASGNGNHATQSVAASQPTASVIPIIYV